MLEPILRPAMQPVPPGFIILSIITLLLVFLLIVLTESVVMQLLGWGDTRTVWKAAIKLNAVSAILTSPLLGMARQWGEGSIWSAWAISIIIEGLILLHLKPNAVLQNVLCALLANTASTLILILPSFRFA